MSVVVQSSTCRRLSVFTVTLDSATTPHRSAGLIALAKSIGQEIGRRGIRANAIAPGFIDTAMTQALPEDIRKAWIQNIPLRRAGTVDDIANVATFLASDMSSYVSGQVIQVDGGMNM